jgi:short-subunit dehydrogenase
MISAGHGTIVTVASVLGHLGAANLSDYTAAKAGLIAMHTSLTAELASLTSTSEDGEKPNIKTMLVTPGQLSTSMFAGLRTPSNFIAPVVEPVDIAKEIIRRVDNGEGGAFGLPLYTNLVGVLNVLPVGIVAILRKLSGIDGALVGWSVQDTRKEKGAKN